MKTKKFSKKLTLNKSTVADLKGNDLKQVMGGVAGSVVTTVYLPCDCNTETDCQGSFEGNCVTQIVFCCC